MTILGIPVSLRRGVTCFNRWADFFSFYRLSGRRVADVIGWTLVGFKPADFLSEIMCIWF